MGMFDFLGREKSVVCPECRTKGAMQKSAKIRCPNRSCPHYDFQVSMQPVPGGVVSNPSLDPQGGFHPGANAVTVQYRNHRGDDAVFVADRTTWRVFDDCVSVRVAPRGARITLRKKFIRNMSALGLASLTPEPRGVDLQVLNYHLRRGTTSARFEEVRRRYPYWRL